MATPGGNGPSERDHSHAPAMPGTGSAPGNPLFDRTPVAAGWLDARRTEPVSGPSVLSREPGLGRFVFGDASHHGVDESRRPWRRLLGSRHQRVDDDRHRTGALPDLVRAYPQQIQNRRIQCVDLAAGGAGDLMVDPWDVPEEAHHEGLYRRDGRRVLCFDPESDIRPRPGTQHAPDRSGCGQTLFDGAHSSRPRGSACPRAHSMPVTGRLPAD